MASQQVKPKKTFKVSIRQDKWTVNLYTFADFTLKYGACQGICEYSHITKDLVISFRGPKVSMDTVAHELMHAYMSHHNLSRCKPDTIEEKVCEIMGKHYRRIFWLTNYIHKRLK